MREVRLPDLKRLKTLKKDLKYTPPQQSAIDTSNWENRKIETFKLLTDDKEHAQHYLNLLHDMDSSRRERILGIVQRLHNKYTQEELNQMTAEDVRRIEESE